MKFEEKYGISLWGLALNERLLYMHNNFYHFSADQIESLLLSECELFDNILTEINPDYLVIKETALHHNHLLHLMCRKKGIKILMLNNTKLGSNKYTISEEMYSFDSFENDDVGEIPKRTFEDLQNLLKSDDSSIKLKKYVTKQASSKVDKINALIDYVIKSKNDNIKTHYSYFGRTKIRVLLNETSNRLKIKNRKSFIDKNSNYRINSNEQYVLLPLHQEPERSLLIAAPFFTNQLETIRHVAKSLPPGYRLYVKEHYSQFLREWREIDYYKKILEIPNVKLFHPSSSMEELIKNSSLVITVSGTTAFEANFYEKPSIIFTKMEFSKLSSIFFVECINDLPTIIRTALKQKVDLDELNQYVTLLEKNSFNFDFINYTLEESKWFRYGGNYADAEISKEKMLFFLKKFENILDNLASRHIEKIEEFTNKYLD